MHLDLSTLHALVNRVRTTAMSPSLIADEIDQAIVSLQAQTEIEPEPEAAPAEAPPSRRARRVSARSKRASRKR